MYEIDVRDTLRDVIKERGFKQSAIAQMANLTPSKLSQTLKKARRLDANEMFAICNAIGINPQDLRAIANQQPT